MGGGGGREAVCVALVEATSLVVNLRGLVAAAADIDGRSTLSCQ
jgi:hypothetical protein